MKKLFIIVVLLVVLIALIFGVRHIFDKPAYLNVTKEEVTAKTDNKENFVLYVYSPHCRFCEMMRPVLNDIIRTNTLTIYGIDVSTPENKDKKIVGEGIPSLIVYENGEEKDRYVGFDGETSEKREAAKQEVLDFLKQKAPFLFSTT